MTVKWIAKNAGPVVRCGDTHDVTLIQAKCFCHNMAGCVEHGMLFIQESGEKSWYEGGVGPSLKPDDSQ